MTENIGIDYGMGLANIDTETGIRFGVIHQNDVGEVWFDSSEPEPIPATICPHCGDDNPDNDAEADTQHCQHCGKDWDPGDVDNYGDTENYVYNDDGYKCWSDSSGDIFIEKSPYYTYAQFCSPCAPGAVHLANPMPKDSGACKGYCFGHDWFEDGRAPYDVYDVVTDNLVNPEADNAKTT